MYLHSWYSIEKDINVKLYSHGLDTGSRSRYSAIIVMPAGNYNGDLLKSTLQSLINPAVAFGSFSVSYDPTAFSISIRVAGNAVVFWVLSDIQIASSFNGFWTDPFRYNKSSINKLGITQLLRLYWCNPSI